MRTVDKNYCMSSYLALRYIEDDAKDFFPVTHHHNISPVPEDERIYVRTAEDIDRALQQQFANQGG